MRQTPVQAPLALIIWQLLRDAPLENRHAP